MGQEGSIKEHYGIGLQDDELILIETYKGKSSWF